MFYVSTSFHNSLLVSVTHYLMKLNSVLDFLVLAFYFSLSNGQDASKITHLFHSFWVLPFCHLHFLPPPTHLLYTTIMHRSIHHHAHDLRSPRSFHGLHMYNHQNLICTNARYFDPCPLHTYQVSEDKCPSFSGI